MLKNIHLTRFIHKLEFLLPDSILEAVSSQRPRKICRQEEIERNLIKSFVSQSNNDSHFMMPELFGLNKHFSWVILVLIMVGCAKSPSLKSTAGEEEKEPSSKEILKKLADKYKDKLVFNKDGIHLFHSLECSGAIANRFLNQQTDPKTGKQTGYKQIIKCRPTKETHTILFSKIKYNRKGYKESYDLNLKCNKTEEDYQIKITEIKYDYSVEVVSYKMEVDGDELEFPLPEEEEKEGAGHPG